MPFKVKVKKENAVTVQQEQNEPKNQIQNVVLTKENLVDEVANETGLDKTIVRRIVIFVNFALKRKDGSPTAFAEKYGIMSYEELYNWFKELKSKYKTDNEVEAFAVMYNDLTKSVVPRASSWIWQTYIQDEKRLDESFIYAVSFVNRAFGYTTENLRLFKSVLMAFDKYTNAVQEFTQEQVYQATEEEKEEEMAS